MASLCVFLVLGLLQCQFFKVFAEKELKKLTGNVTLTVTAILDKPFLMEIKDLATLTGNDRFEGFIKDALDEISEKTGLRYTLNVQKGITYTDMVQEIVNKKADLAAGSLTINTARTQKIDMSKPLMSAGITVLMKKSNVMTDVPPPVDMSFVMKPFGPAVWCCLLLAAGLVTGCFYIINRFDPHEKHVCPHQEKKRDKEDEKRMLHFNMVACIWMVLGGLTLQGYTKRPRSTAALFLFFVWWAFCMVVFAFYLSGIMRSGVYEVSPYKVAKFKSFVELFEHHKIKFGALKAGATNEFFKTSKVQMYFRAGKFMESYPSSMVSSLTEGLERVRKEKYALLAETPFVEYVSGRRPCDVMQVGGRLNSIGYGFGMAKLSRHRYRINMAILALREEGRLDMLRRKWWHSVCDMTAEKESEAEWKSMPPAEPLTMGSIGGVFIIFFVGVLVAMFIMVIEVFMHGGNESQSNESAEKTEETTMELT